MQLPEPENHVMKPRIRARNNTLETNNLPVTPSTTNLVLISMMIDDWFNVLSSGVNC